MPRKRNPVGIAAGKLILVIQKELNEVAGKPEAERAQKALRRARTLLQASESSSVANFLDGRTVVEYLDCAWVEMHPSVKAQVEAFVAALGAHEEQ
jgi:hypothetical protein